MLHIYIYIYIYDISRLRVKHEHLLMCSCLKVFIQRGNIVHLHALKTERGRSVVPALTLALDRRRVFNVTPRSLYPTSNSYYPLNRRLCGPRNWSGGFGGKEKFLVPYRKEFTCSNFTKSSPDGLLLKIELKNWS